MYCISTGKKKIVSLDNNFLNPDAVSSLVFFTEDEDVAKATLAADKENTEKALIIGTFSIQLYFIVSQHNCIIIISKNVINIALCELILICDALYIHFVLFNKPS